MTHITTIPNELRQRDQWVTWKLTVHPNSSGVSFETDTPLALARWLNAQHGYDAELPRSNKELARLWMKGSLVVCYHSGTALIQSNPEPSISLLNSLVATQLDLVGATGGQR